MRAAALLLGALPAAAVAAPYAVRLDVAQCAALPARDAAALGADWAALARYAQRCRVPGPDGRVALLVDLVRVDRALDDDVFKGRPGLKPPLPVLRDARGTKVGRLPDGFPVDPPSELKVRFTRWQGGMPGEIALYEAGESAVSPHPLPPLRWDARTRRYR